MIVYNETNEHDCYLINTVSAIMFNLVDDLSYTRIQIIRQRFLTSVKVRSTQFYYWKRWGIANTGDCRFHARKSNIW